MKIQWTAHESGDKIMILAIRPDGKANALEVDKNIDVWRFRAVIKSMTRDLQ